MLPFAQCCGQIVRGACCIGGRELGGLLSCFEGDGVAHDVRWGGGGINCWSPPKPTLSSQLIVYSLRVIRLSHRVKYHMSGDSFKNRQKSMRAMAAVRMSRRCRRYLKRIQRAASRYALQEIASTIQNDLDRRHLSYDEALNLGNVIQHHADRLPGDTIVYAISDRDAYRRTLELYLKDAVLSRTEQLLLWEERRRLGISDTEHDRLLNQLVEQMKRQGRTVAVHAFKKAGA